MCLPFSEAALREHDINLQHSAPVLAEPDDATAIGNLRTQLVDWMYEREIDQWHHGEVGPERVREQVIRQEWWLVRTANGTIAATARIIDEDPMVWETQDRRAMYLHGLMVDRRYAGQRLGHQLLDWAAARARARGAELLRLDCVASNADLCDYYLHEGFIRVGTKQFQGNWAATALFERSVAADEKA